MRDAASRVAFAAFLHDLGKFAERARLAIDDDILQIRKETAPKEIKTYPDRSFS